MLRRFYPDGKLFDIRPDCLVAGIATFAEFNNNGAITSFNTIFFGGQRTSPYQSTGPADWYLNLVNTAISLTKSTFIWSRFFENTGIIVVEVQ